MMAPRIITDSEARGLLESFSVECDDCDGAGHHPCPVCGHANDEEMCNASEPDFVQHDDSRHIRCELCDGRGVVSDDDEVPEAHVVIDLAHTVIALHAEVVRGSVERVEMTERWVRSLLDQQESARAAWNALDAENAVLLARLREVMEGRTTPPTNEEIVAHAKAGGRWRCVVPSALQLCADAMHGHAARMHRDTIEAAGHDSVWWATDARARPCAWPVVEAQKGGAR